MPKRSHFRLRSRAGIVYIMGLVFLTVLSALAIVLVSTTSTGLRQAENSRQVLNARLATESGLAVMLQVLQGVQLPADTTEEILLENLRAGLAETLEGTNNFDEGAIQKVGQVVTVPTINYGEGSFSSQFTLGTEGRYMLTVTGQAGNVTRTASIELMPSAISGSAFEYGIASRGRVAIGGSSTIEGVNQPEEAKVLSILNAEEVIRIQGAVTITGELFLSEQGATVDIQGNSASVAGTNGKDNILNNCVNFVTKPEFPEIDTAQFAPLATNVMDSASDYNQSTYSNIRIAANTNPEFGNDVVLNGIVYIEAPNDVTFKNDCVINGMVVTEDGSDFSFDDCQLTFKSKVSVPGVEVLPDTSEFVEVKKHTGTFLLAPGFGANFHAQVNSNSGTIAADKLDFWGHCDLTIKGLIMGLSERDMTFHGHNTITIDNQNTDQTPAGFNLPLRLTPDPDSYVE